TYTPESLYTLSTPPTIHGDLEPEELVKIWEGLNSVVIDTYGPKTSLDVLTIYQLSMKLWPNVRGGRRKAGSGTTEQETDQQGRSGSRRGNEQVMNKFKLATRLKARKN